MLTVKLPPETIAPSTDAESDHSHVHPLSGDRRRPGRPETVSPHLLSLLRPAVVARLPLSKSRANDPLRDLGTSVGIVVAISLCALFWVVIGLVVSGGR